MANEERCPLGFTVRRKGKPEPDERHDCGYWDCMPRVCQYLAAAEVEIPCYNWPEDDETWDGS